MGFRFRKSVKLLPGVRVNFGLNGASLSVGPRGASVSIGKNGTHTNLSIPGTGISFREKVGHSSAQKKRLEERYVNAQMKIEREQHRQDALSDVKVTLQDDGTVSFTNKFGDSLSKKEISMAWAQNGEALKALLQDGIDEINGDIELLTMIHTDIPNPNSMPEYQSQEYSVAMPQKPSRITMPKRPEKLSVKKPLFFMLIFNKIKTDYEHELQQASDKYQTDLTKWEENKQIISDQYTNDLATYEDDLKNWEKSKEAFDKNEAKKAEAFSTLIEIDKDTMETTFDNLLQGLEWPRETLVNYMVSNDLNEIWIDVDLPEIEDLPSRIASLASSGNKLNIKNKSQKQLRLEYATHIHGIALRLAGFSFATLPSVQKVIVSGFSQRLNSSSGITMDDYLYSVSIDRNIFQNLNHDDLTKIDPVASFDMFNALRKMTSTGILQPITPYQVV